MSNIPKGTKGSLKMSQEQSVYLQLIIERRGWAVICVPQGHWKQSWKTIQVTSCVGDKLDAEILTY